jgi:hypothetical protein
MKSLLVEYLRNILEQGDVLDTVLTYKDRQGKERTVTARSVQKQGQQHPAWPQLQQLLGPRGQMKGEKPSKQQKADTSTGTSTTAVDFKNIKAPRAPRVQRVKIDKTKSTEEEITSLLGETKLDADALYNALRGVDSSEGGDRGAGTASSAAGEAATTLLLQRMAHVRKESASTSTVDEFLKNYNDETIEFLSKLRGLDRSILDESWARAARKQVFSILHTLENHYKTEIDEIAWDNSSGRSGLGLGPKPPEDRSDLYVKSDDGRVIGISLKKDGNVFLANQGLKKVLEEVSKNAPDEETRKKIIDVAGQHSKIVASEFKKLIQIAKKHKDQIKDSLRSFNRAENRDLSASKYNIYFDDQGNLTDESLEMLTSGGISLTKTAKGQQKALTGNEQKLLLRVMPFADNEEATNSLNGMRDADKVATQSLLKLIDTDESVNSTVTDYLIDALDLVQLVTEGRPFGSDYPVDEFFISYGEANLTPDGQGMPLSVTRDTVLRTLNLPESLSDDELKSAIKQKFIVDTEDDGKVGFLRLRIVNDEPPPEYFYPSIATLGVRSRGLKAAPLMELAQHSGWTYTLINGTANPNDWPEHQKKAHAIDTLKFLNRKIKDPSTTDSEKKQMETELKFYIEIAGGG